MTNAVLIAERLCLTPSGDEFVGDCPCCGYENGFSIVDKDKRTLFHCHAGGCTQQELIHALRKYGLWGSPSPQAAEFPGDLPIVHPSPTRKSSRIEAALEIWGSSQPAPGTIVETYLRARGYFGPIPISLHYVKGKHRSDQKSHPIMLAAAMLPGDPPEIVGVHRTFLLEDGSGKALLTPAKMSVGNLRGAGVPLAKLGPKVAVSEGIETGLSVQQATGIPTYAALSTAGMKALLLPTVVCEVVIAADPDDVGMKAAKAAARRWHAEGRIVRIAKPPGKLDFNDLARRGP